MAWGIISFVILWDFNKRGSADVIMAILFPACVQYLKHDKYLSSSEAHGLSVGYCES